MDKPYIIWTLRRTGGTTLATLLGKTSSHKALQHEPFNPDRLYGNITRDWNETFDPESMRSAVSKILDDGVVVKHCYEVVPLQLNVILLQEATKRGYEHIILKRRAEVDRILSLEIAGLTGAWGPGTADTIFAEFQAGKRPSPVLPLRKSIVHMSDCYLRSTWLLSTLNSLDLDYSTICFEDLFTDLTIGKSTINALLARLGHSGDKIADLQTAVEQALSINGQNTQQIEPFVENGVSWRHAMERAWETLEKPSNQITGSI